MEELVEKLRMLPESASLSIWISLVCQCSPDKELLHLQDWEPQGLDGSRMHLAEFARQCPRCSLLF